MESKPITTHEQFFLSFKSLCPGAWVQRWDDQRGTYLTMVIFKLKVLMAKRRGRHLPREARLVDASIYV